jgi:prepilin-type N-terminal cleavage/methylation domain-containing protein
MPNNYRFLKPGFTIIEIIVVIAVIAILATLVTVSYSGVQTRAVDVGILSDLDSMDSIQTSYGLRNNTSGRAYYSGDGFDPDLNFTPTGNNVIDVVVNSTDYCIRGYNVQGSKNSIYDAFIKESSPGVCDSIDASPDAIANSPGDPPAGDGWQQISSGFYHTCGIWLDYKAYCWGRNTNGELGNGSYTNTNVPVAVDTSGELSGKTILYIAAGERHTCAIASDHRAYCWGNNVNGKLGDGTSSSSNVPVAVYVGGVLNGLDIISIAAGWEHTCVVASDDYAYCWGDNSDDQLGDGSGDDSDEPVAVSKSGNLSGLTINSISAGDEHTCVVASDDNAYCWGSNNDGQLGDNSYNDRVLPVPVYRNDELSGLSIVEISANDEHTCALASDGNAYCWGENNDGELGDNSSVANEAPVGVYRNGQISGLNVLSITTGDEHSCVVASNYRAYCWGSNSHGQIGDDDVSNDKYQPVAVYVSSDSPIFELDIDYVSAGGDHTCVISSDHALYCWGDNYYGSLGDGANDNSDRPVAVIDPS